MKLLIIGNGFDLDLGLNTTYPNFYNYSCFSKKSKDELLPDSLEVFLKDKTEIRWADLEESMATYVRSKKGKILDSIIDSDKRFLKNLKDQFSDFIEDNWSEITKVLYKTPIKESLAKLLIEIQNKTHCFDAIYSFNCLPYIDLPFASDTEIESLSDAINIHGSYNEFIFGIRIEDCTREEYSFLVKENQESYPHEVAQNFKRDLMSAEDVVFFGHSLNRIDMVYFEQFFNNANKLRTITIIDRNKKSYEKIKRNITEYAISLKELKNSCKVSFISTEEYDARENLEKVDELFNYLNRT